MLHGLLHFPLVVQPLPESWTVANRHSNFRVAHIANFLLIEPGHKIKCRLKRFWTVRNFLLIWLCAQEQLHSEIKQCLRLKCWVSAFRLFWGNVACYCNWHNRLEPMERYMCLSCIHWALIRVIIRSWGWKIGSKHEVPLVPKETTVANMDSELTYDWRHPNRQVCSL